MRIENSARNGAFGMIRTILQVLLTFVVRTIFIRTLGEEYLGLDSLFSSILGVLSLAELGFGGAIVYSMYKPIAENDQNKISALIQIYKKIYFTVGVIVFVAGCILLPFLQFLISGDTPANINIYVVFFIFLLNTSAGYFFAYKRSLIYANQRTDIESKVATIFLLGLKVLQIILLLVFKNYYLYIIFIPIFAVAENIVVSVIANKMFPTIKNPLPLPLEDKRSLKKSMFAMIGHKVGSVVVFSTDNILMSAFLGLSIVGLYNNYFMLISAIATFISILVRSMIASIGNSIAEESVEKNYKNFKDLSFINFWIIAFCASCFVALFQDFITIWIGKEYLLGEVVVLFIVINFVFQQSRNIVNSYRDTTGTFYNDRFKPFVEAGVNLVASIILAQYIGLLGIIIGTTISTVFIDIPVEAYVLQKNYFNKSTMKYLLYHFANILLIFAVSALTYLACYFIPLSGIWEIVVKMAICLVVPNAVMLLLFFKTESFRYFKNILKSVLKKVFKKKSADKIDK